MLAVMPRLHISNKVNMNQIAGFQSVDEFDLISKLVSNLPRKAEGLLYGVGDDCAVLTGSGKRDWLISTDNFVENVHFRRDWSTWMQIGNKAVAAAVSDISAMGGKPRFLTVGMSIPEDVNSSMVEECYKGIRSAANHVNALVIGGDITRSAKSFYINITAIGEVEHGRAIYRSGARAGDAVYVTGTFGGPRMGLTMLQKNMGDADHRFIRRHLEPPSRFATGQWLASTGCVTAMIDVSDGLAADFGKIADASGVSFHIEGGRIPLMTGLIAEHQLAGVDPLQVAISSGEEYELIFTVSGARVGPFQQIATAAERVLGHPLTCVGSVLEGNGCYFFDTNGSHIPVEDRGFSHQFTA